ncbi:MAG: cytidylate kinase, partial [Bacteroidales bacterium]|nr:cytidylate kinase [Bacteroidales bacterium]
LTASPEIRALRRFNELKEKGENITYEEVLANIKERDERDSNRLQSPVRKADDAVELDNSNLTVEEQLQWALDVFNKKMQQICQYG